MTIMIPPKADLTAIPATAHELPEPVVVATDVDADPVDPGRRPGEQQFDRGGWWLYGK
ncbi:hypothetical protein SCAR479_07306 [Seiridium cardinale]|uniref:Uncharacterized protein n=1 Tax=Seiridium cardinale TaxID=138064 RepID=A0ABR2XQK1_9PEZI